MYLQVTRTCIKGWRSLDFDQIPRVTTDLAVLERLKDLYPHFFSVHRDPMLFKLADNEDMCNILSEFGFWPDWTTHYRVSCPSVSEHFPQGLIIGQMVSPVISVVFGPILLKLNTHYS